MNWIQAIFLLLTLPAVAFAQDRGDDGGGRRGGWGGGPGDFLRRMDANGNGMIDPEEAEGRSGFFLRRMAENNPDIDLSKPVPLEKLEQATAAARERWDASRGSEGRGPGGPPSGDGERDGRREEGNEQRPNNSTNSKPSERLVPGFGEVADAPVVPGFGLMTKALAIIKVTDADRQEAQRRFGWYDRDSNGVIEGDEMEQARSRGYQEYDSNQDGKLTLDELAMRYARRRVEEEAAAKAAAVASSNSSSSNASRRDDERSPRDAGRSSSSNNSRSSSSKAASGKPYRIAPADERLAKMGLPNWFLDKDDDNDGQVAMAEYGESWSDSALAEFAKFDLNGDGVITPEECLRAGKGGASLASVSSRGGYGSRSGGAESSYRGFGSRSETAQSKAPTVATTAKVEEERKSSGDESGVAVATSPKASRDSEAAASAPVAAASNKSSQAAAPAAVESSGTVDPRYVNYANGRIKQVDANGDGVLQPDEWIKMSKSPAAADVNGDQRITPNELGAWFQKQ